MFPSVHVHLLITSSRSAVAGRSPLFRVITMSKSLTSVPCAYRGESLVLLLLSDHIKQRAPPFTCSASNEATVLTSPNQGMPNRMVRVTASSSALQLLALGCCGASCTTYPAGLGCALAAELSGCPSGVAAVGCALFSPFVWWQESAEYESQSSLWACLLLMFLGCLCLALPHRLACKKARLSVSRPCVWRFLRLFLFFFLFLSLCFAPVAKTKVVEQHSTILRVVMATSGFASAWSSKLWSLLLSHDGCRRPLVPLPGRVCCWWPCMPLSLSK